MTVRHVGAREEFAFHNAILYGSAYFVVNVAITNQTANILPYRLFKNDFFSKKWGISNHL